MAFFVLNGVPVPIAEGSQEDPEEQIGGSVRSFTGQLRTRVRARLRSWSLRTAELTGVDMADLLDELRGPGTVDVTGDWFNAVCRAEIGAEGPVPGDAGFFTLEFRLVEIGEVVGPQLPEDPEEQMELEQDLAALNSGLTIAQNDITGIDASISTLLDRTQGTVSVTEPPFNATGDGVTDDRAAVQLAIDTMSAAGGGELVFPPGHYLFGDTIFLRSFVRLVGSGRNTILENISTGGDLNRITFQLGTYGASGGVAPPQNNSAKYDVSSGALVGSYTITLLNSADAANFQEGDVVFLFNNDLVHGSNTISEFSQINKVTGINGASITLQHPLYKDFDGTSPQVTVDRLCQLVQLGQPCRVVERATLSNLTIRANTQINPSSRWLRSAGAYQCLVEDIWLENVAQALVIQGAAYCTFRNLTGTVTSPGIACAYFAHDDIVDGVNLTWAGFSVDTNNNFIFLHENPHHITIRNVKADLGDTTTYSSVIALIDSGEDNLIENVEARGSGIIGGLIRFFFEEAVANVPKQGNVVRNCNMSFPANSTTQIAVRETFNTERKARPNVVEDCTLFTNDGPNTSQFLNGGTGGGSDYEFRRIYTNRYGTVPPAQSPLVQYTTDSLGVRAYDIIGQAENNSVRLQNASGANNQAQPRVLVGDVFHASNTNATTITQFIGGYVGKEITIQATTVNTMIEHGTNILLKGGVNKTLAFNEVIRFVQLQPDRWYEV